MIELPSAEGKPRKHFMSKPKTPNRVRSSELIMAHCSACHETFPNSEVKILQSRADVCPRCKNQNFTCVLDGHHVCGCGEK